MINIINTIAPNPKANTFKISVLKDEMNFAKNKNRIPKNRTEIIQNNNQVNLGFVNPRILIVLEKYVLIAFIIRYSFILFCFIFINLKLKNLLTVFNSKKCHVVFLW